MIRLPHSRMAIAVAVAAVVAAVAALAGLGVAARYAYAGDVPRGTSVLGVDLGGLSRSEAAERLREALATGPAAEAVAAPVAVRVGSVDATLDPAEVGLAVDVDATVAAAAERPNPLVDMVRAVTGARRRIDPVVTVDPDRLHQELRGHLAEDVTAMTMPEIRYDEDLNPVPVYPEPGHGLDPAASAATVTAGWPPQVADEPGWRDPLVITVPLVEVHPVTTAEDVDRLVAELAEPAVAAPVTATLPGDRDLVVGVGAIAASLRLTADSQGEIVPAVDPAALREALREPLTAVETPPVGATVVFQDGQPALVPGDDGEQVDLPALASDLLAVLAEPAPRTVAGTLGPGSPAVAPDVAEDLGIQERVSSFTTFFDGGLESPRTQNILLIAEMVDGAVVEPGETFSLNGFTGPRGYEEGFQDAPVILDGRLQPAVGGGLSQFTTTLFNAAYYAGLEIREHHPHSFYYSHYPPVIESTIFYDTLDMKFHNNTEHGVLIETAHTADSITISMWSTRIWDRIDTEWGPRTDPSEPRRRYVDPGPTCIDTAGIPGFAQRAWRVFYQDGNEVEREEFGWRYDAQPEVICAEEPDE